MTAATPVGAAPVLRRAVLLAAILVVIAGFLGMRIFSGTHGMHSQELAPGSAGQAAEVHHAGSTSMRALDGHASHNAGPTAPPPAAAAHVSVMPAAVTVGGTDMPPSCVCQDGCPDKPSAHIDCTPSPAGATLSAPQPGTTPLALKPWAAALADRQPDYAYFPRTPTPRDLSISRT